MGLIPGSPRPEASDPEGDGVYRSIFQQPQIDIPPAAPSYAWFEFLLHPEALQKHLDTLRHQNAHGQHSATSAIELVREFLDQAQLVADEGNLRNNRYTALLLVAAQVALDMKMSLSTIENALPLHFQRLLVDGIVDFAESKEPRNAFTQHLEIAPYAAHVVHNRWTLRAIVNQAQNGYLTCSNKNEADELTTSFQLALGDLSKNHASVADNLQAIVLNDEQQPLPKHTQVAAMYDLGVYFFTFGAYEKAYEFFSRAAEMLEEKDEDPDLQTALSQDESERLEGYLMACQAVLEATFATDQERRLATTEVEAAWEKQEYERAVRLLEEDMVAHESTRLPVRIRQEMEQKAQQLARQQGPQYRAIHQHMVVINALAAVVHTTEKRTHTTQVEICVNTLFRLVQDELFGAATSEQSTMKALKDLVFFIVRLCDDLFRQVSTVQQALVRRVMKRLIANFPFLTKIEGVMRHLASFQIDSVVSCLTVEELIALEVALRHAIGYQRNHFRQASDLSNLFVFGASKSKDDVLAALHQLSQPDELMDLLERQAKAHPTNQLIGKNLVVFCMLHNCWDLLAQWKATSVHDNAAQCVQTFFQFVGIALACRSLMEFVTDAIDAKTFSVAESNRLMSELLTQRRDLLVIVNSEQEEALVLLDLPLWALETLVCVSAGLLHRASIWNLSEHRIAFDLTPYGDLALLYAFVSEASRSSNDTTDHISTTALIKSFQADLVQLFTNGLACLLKRCPREPRWHCANADLALNPLVKLKLVSPSDPSAALRGYLVAASLATNFFSDATSVVDIIDQSSLVRLSQCLVKLGANVAAAVLYQCFAPDDFKYGLRILQLAPETHDETFFQYFWELPFLELLVHLHSSPKQYNASRVTLLTHLIQSPELNSSNPPPVLKDVENRILRCYFRDLCRMFLTE